MDRLVLVEGRKKLWQGRAGRRGGRSVSLLAEGRISIYCRCFMVGLYDHGTTDALMEQIESPVL